MSKMTAHLDVPGQVFYERDTPRTFKEFFQGFQLNHPIIWHSDQHTDRDVKCLKLEGETEDVMRVMHFWTSRINRFQEAAELTGDLHIGQIQYERRIGDRRLEIDRPEESS